MSYFPFYSILNTAMVNMTKNKFKTLIFLFGLVLAGKILAPADQAVIIMDADTGQVLRLENPKMAVESSFTTGSLIKPFSALYGLKENIISPMETVQCDGSLSIEGKKFECWQHPGHGPLNLYKGLAYSCNVYFYHYGYRFDAGKYLDFLRTFGFGKKTGIDLPNEDAGLLPGSMDTLEKTGTAAAGSPQLLITPIQAATAFAALVNGGKLLKPFIKKGKPVIREDLNLGTQLPILYRALQEAATYGTASGFYQETGGFAKTGTAKWADGFHTHAWLAGYVPIGDRKIVILVFVYNGTGAKDALPLGLQVAKELIRQARDQQEVKVSLFSLLKPKTLTIEARFGQLLVDGRTTGGGTGGDSGISGNNEEKQAYRCRSAEVKYLADGNLKITIDGQEKEPLHSLEIRGSNPDGFFALQAGGQESREYVGVLTIRANEDYLDIIETLPLKEYLEGVVGNELDGFPEAMKCQAVLSRTYALKNLLRHGESDFCDSTHCQLYTGRLTSHPEANGETGVHHAVEDTSGLVLVYHNKMCEVFYHSTCGGHTNDYNGVWVKSDIPYLEGIDDLERCQASPHYRWQWEIEKNRLLDILREITGETPVDMRIKDTGNGGWVKQISIFFPNNRETVLSGEDFHIQMGRRMGWNSLKSANFTLQKNDTNWVFAGKGFGHGVGLCQYGAGALAGKGMKFHDILKTYLPGTKVDYHWSLTNDR